MNNLWCTNYSSVRTNTRFTVNIEEVQCNFLFPSALPRGVAAVNIYVVDPPLNLTLMLDNICSYFV